MEKLSLNYLLIIMYIFYFILCLGTNIVLSCLFSKDYDMYLCLVLCLMNIITYPVFYTLLTSKSPVNNPIVKNLNFSNYRSFGKTAYIIYECKKLIRYNIGWLFLVVFPCIISFWINKNLWDDFTIMEFFICMSYLSLILMLWGLSAVIRNFYNSVFWVFFLILGNLLLYCIIFAPQQEDNNQYLLYLSVSINFLCFLAGILLTVIEKRKKQELPSD
ncbi:MAG: hypothetical protein LBH32_05545 [Dysgonamonadaceae bacterium]|jgi:hypothetical protein|nr:hypothetical protein [Dysgonamonadaceae bacterium]